MGGGGGGTVDLNNRARNKKLLNSFRYKNGMGQSRSIVIEKALGRNTDKRNSITLFNDTKNKIIRL